MRIAIIASGSQGDVQPYLALAKGLKGAGHIVHFVTHSNFESFVTSHGVEFWRIGGNVQEIAQSAEMTERVEKGNFISLMAQMKKEAERGATELAEGGLAACQGMDLIVAGMGGLFVGIAIAEKLRIPFLQAYVLPFTPSRYFSSVLVSDPPKWFGANLNLLSHFLTRQLIWQGFRSADNLARKNILHLPLAPFSGPYHSNSTKGLPILYGFSPSVISAPPDWDGNSQITGYWFLDSPDNWIPNQALSDFIKSGTPPVYVGFGSMSSRNSEETAELVLGALRKINQRAILFSGWGGLQKADLPDSIFMIDSTPHSWLFPHMAAVVHHGGAGTTAAGFRAGVPSLVVPFFGDQPYWGHRIVQLGVGPPRFHEKN